MEKYYMEKSVLDVSVSVRFHLNLNFRFMPNPDIKRLSNIRIFCVKELVERCLYSPFASPNLLLSDRLDLEI